MIMDAEEVVVEEEDVVMIDRHTFVSLKPV